MIRPLGLLEDDLRHPRESFAAIRSQFGASPRGHADLKDFVYPMVIEQLVGCCALVAVPSSACTTARAQAAATGKGRTIDFVPSQVFPYQAALRLDRADDHPGVDPSEMPRLRDVGTQMLTAVKVISEYGFVPMGEEIEHFDGDLGVWRYFATDAGPSNTVDEAAFKIATVIRAAKTKAIGAFEMVGVNRLRDMKLVLDANMSFPFGGFVDSKYMRRTASSPPAGKQDYTDPDGGGHAQECVGYKTDASGNTLWTIKNSWGPGWGDGGYTEVNDEFMAQLWTAIVMKIEVLP